MAHSATVTPSQHSQDREGASSPALNTPSRQDRAPEPQLAAAAKGPMPVWKHSRHSHMHPWHWRDRLASPSKGLVRCVPHSHGTLPQGLPMGKVGMGSCWSRGWATPASES